MKMVFVVYSKAADYDVITSLKAAGVSGYTKMERACGEGVETEPKLHSHTWPGENCVMFIGVGDEELDRVTEIIRELKVKHPRSGVKAFVMPMEEII
ncbi:MAG TPA: hypothetical protein PLW83_00950 [Deltaproteobacteria bacterium]|nr:hypothetical protein [Deltaproteobacteria bacterium]